MKHIHIFLLLLFSVSLAAQSSKRADKEYEMGQYGLAVNSYLRAIESNPSDGAIMTRIGDCYRMLNRLTEAKDWYAKALTSAGSQPIALFQQGQMLKGLGKYDEAQVIFDKYALVNAAVGKHFSNSCVFAKKMQAAPSPYVVKLEYLNTSNSEFNTTFFGEMVLFNSLPPKAMPDHEGMNYTNLVLSSLDQNNYLKIPTAFSDELHANTKIGPLAYDVNGNQVFYSLNNFKQNNRPIPDGHLEMSLYFAKLNGDGTWMDPQPFPFNGAGYSTGYPSLSPDGKTLYFASDRPDGYGGWDIYLSRKIGNTWTKPENLGPVLNTAGDEIYPFYDGKQLFFSSSWHPGLGGFDIFRADRTTDSWDRIFHLGNAVNSPKDDLGYVYSETLKLGYLSSNRSGGKGNMDIYRLQRQTDQIIINVTDASGNPVPDVVIDFSACGEASYRTNSAGQYSFQALGGFNCNATLSKSGFASQEVPIVAKGAAGQKVINVDLSKAAKKIPGKIVLAGANQAIADVLVRATDQKTGQVLESYSDPTGSYGLALNANTTYVVRFSKAGFSDTHKKITTGAAVSNELLGVLELEEVYAASSSNTTNSGSSSAAISTGAYSVQLAAVKAGNAINLGEFLDLENEGDVYLVEENGLKKVRLGNFESRQRAERALAVCKGKGFGESFIVKDENATMASTPPPAVTNPPVVENPVPAPTTTTTTTRPPAPQPTNYESGTSAVNTYKIRLATYGNTAYFKPEKILAYGEIERVKKGKLTIMLLVSFDRLEEARQILPKVKAAGFKTAHIIHDVNGDWKRLPN